MAELSPMMKQYFSIKENNKDSILFFRLGDFYEMFFEDAKVASKELELTLTGRDCGQEERAPMCGVPFHSAENYIARLVSKGYKVAICEQTEDPSQAKGIVKRDIIRVITPGTVMESSMLDESTNNYICCAYSSDKNIGLCFCDISTGQLNVTCIDAKDAVSVLKTQLTSYAPKEIILGGKIKDNSDLLSFIKDKLSSFVSFVDENSCGYLDCSDIVLSQFGVKQAENIADNKIVIIQSTMIPINNFKPFCFNSSIITLKLNASFKLLNLAILQRAMISDNANISEMIKLIINVMMTFKVGGTVSITPEPVV